MTNPENIFQIALGTVRQLVHLLQKAVLKMQQSFNTSLKLILLLV